NFRWRLPIKDAVSARVLVHENNVLVCSFVRTIDGNINPLQTIHITLQSHFHRQYEVNLGLFNIRDIDIFRNLSLFNMEIEIKYIRLGMEIEIHLLFSNSTCIIIYLKTCIVIFVPDVLYDKFRQTTSIIKNIIYKRTFIFFLYILQQLTTLHID
ncbi:hypothetical protein ACJX0J_021901, partial [Zea mays]